MVLGIIGVGVKVLSGGLYVGGWEDVFWVLECWDLLCFC